MIGLLCLQVSKVDGYVMCPMTEIRLEGFHGLPITHPALGLCESRRLCTQMYIYDDDDDGGETVVLQGRASDARWDETRWWEGQGHGSSFCSRARGSGCGRKWLGAGQSIDVPGTLGRSLQSQRGPWWQHPDFLPRLPTTHSLSLARHGFCFLSAIAGLGRHRCWPTVCLGYVAADIDTAMQCLCVD